MYEIPFLYFLNEFTFTWSLIFCYFKVVILFFGEIYGQEP